MTPALTIIIPSWDGWTYLSACLESVTAQLAAGDAVIVVDNGSADGTPAQLRRHFPGVECIGLARNRGVPVAWNIGAQAAATPLLLFLNQDLILLPGALAALRAAATEAGVGAVGCKILSFDSASVYHAGGAIDWPLGRGRHPGYGEPDSPALGRRACDYVSGAVLAVRRDLVLGLGGFDTQFSPGYYEDVDFCVRVRAAGLAALYIPEAVALHHESTSLGRNSERLYRTLHTNRLRFVLKHHGAAGVAWGDFLAAERALLAEPWNEAMAAAMAWIYDGVAVAELTPAGLAALVQRRGEAIWPQPRWPAA